jgi:hypothetical protein
MSFPLLTYEQADKDFIMKIYKKNIDEEKCVDSIRLFGDTPLTNACRIG